jgi:hypothetical protein
MFILLQDPGKVIHACSEDMIKLWDDSTIQRVLEYQKLRLQDLPGLCVPTPPSPSSGAFLALY